MVDISAAKPTTSGDLQLQSNSFVLILLSRDLVGLNISDAFLLLRNIDHLLKEDSITHLLFSTISTFKIKPEAIYCDVFNI